MKTSPKKVGVIVGRFQVAKLHDGHKKLFSLALSENDVVVAMLGKGGALPTDRNPLPFQVRTRVIHDEFPSVWVMEHLNHPSDAEWSKNLDEKLKNQFPEAKITLYASRDSFVPHYSGELSVVIVPMVRNVSGTGYRAQVTDTDDWDTSFRKGMIVAQQLRHAISYQAVDIAVVKYPEMEILLGQKTTDGGKWRLIGGFVDPKDESLEGAALRELSEEAGNVLTHELKYVGSYRVNDWRYREERDKIMTALFLTYHLGGAPRAGDDLTKIAWHPLSIDENNVVPEHRPLFAEIVETIAKKGGRDEGHISA